MDPDWDAYLFSKGGVSRWLREFDYKKFQVKGWYRYEDRKRVDYTDEEYQAIIDGTDLIYNIGG